MNFFKKTQKTRFSLLVGALIGFFLVPSLSFAYSPSVQTLSPIFVGNNCAVLHGTVDPRGSTDTIWWFEYGNGSLHTVAWTRWTEIGTGSQDLTAKLTALRPDTVYYFRMVAQNSSDISHGSEVSFKTGANYDNPFVSVSCDGYIKPGTPNPIVPITVDPGVVNTQSVATLNPTNVTENSMQLNASVFPAQNTNTYGWFKWGKTPDLGNVTVAEQIGAGPSSPLSETISGLLPGTTYFFQPVVQSAKGRTEGLMFSFRTAGVAPYVPPSTTPTVKPTPKPTGTINTNPTHTYTKLSTTTVSTGNTINGKATTTNDSGLAAAGTRSFLDLTLRDRLMILAHILFAFALYFLFIFFCKGKEEKKDEAIETENAEKISNESLLEMQAFPIPVSPYSKTEKGLPPTNLPV